jgi:hypothetical protein
MELPHMVIANRRSNGKSVGRHHKAEQLESSLLISMMYMAVMS